MVEHRAASGSRREALASPRARLLCRTGELAGLTRDLGDDTDIGRAAGNQITLQSEFVSQRHVRIFRRDGDYFLEDLGSRNGTSLDGVRVTESAVRLDRLHVISLADAVDLIFVRETRARVSPNEEPAAGPEPNHPPTQNASMTVMDAGGFGPLPDLDSTRSEPTPSAEDSEETQPQLQLVFAAPSGTLRTVRLSPGPNIIGRSTDCDVSILDREMGISRRHARLTADGDGALLEDLGSSNGTFVEGRRVQTARLAPGASFQLGPTLEFTLLRR